MNIRRSALVAAAALAGAVWLSPAPAAAGGTKVVVGVGVGFGGYYGYPRPYYGHGPYWGPRYYYPPPVVYVPPPAYYHPPPAYYPAPVYYPAPTYYPPAQPAPVNMIGSPPPSPGWHPGQTYCREWQGQAQIGGQVQDVHGTVCRQPDGSWRFQG